MNRFMQHIPNFVSGGEPLVFSFDRIEDLLALPHFKRFSSEPEFSHFCLSENRLLLITDGGFHWWVLGTVKHPEAIDLPQWEGWKFNAVLDGEDVVLGKEVVSSCGDVLTLRNGRRAIAKR